MYNINIGVTAFCINDDLGEDYIKVDMVSKCPACSCVWQPQICGAVYEELQSYYNRLHIHAFCTNCNQSSLIGYYYHSGEIANKCFVKIPHGYEEKKFDDVIKNLSPSFVKIYNEAAVAEAEGILEVAGVGYRKAFEFLVKDYAISLFPGDKNDIEEMFLGKCIKTYIKVPQISDIVERTVWLGNDQTHYKKKIVIPFKSITEGKNINQIKVTIIQTDEEGEDD